MKSPLKGMLLFTAIFTLQLSTYAQSNEEQWVKINSTVLLIEEADLTPELLNELEEKKTQYIIYSNELKQSDIDIYEASLNNSATAFKTANIQADAIKEWLAKHPDIKIVTRSDYDNCSQDKKAVYETINALILETDEITIQDIENYN